MRQLMLASEFYENREEHLMDDDTSAIPPQPSKPRGMLGREAIARAAFHKWWQDQPHSSCVFTARRRELARAQHAGSRAPAPSAAALLLVVIGFCLKELRV